MKKLPAATSKKCTAIIADMVGSRQYDAATRRMLQQRLEQVLGQWNRTYRKSLLARFTITTGDEFQGLLKKMDCLLDMIRSLEATFPDAEFRFGVGFGELFTDLTPAAIGMDGPVWHNARAAITLAKSEKQLGGVFVGFGDFSPALNSLAHFLHHHFRSMTHQQRQIADLLRLEMAVKDIADQLGLTATNVSRQKKAIAWPMLLEGEQAMQVLLKRFDTSEDWTTR